MKSVIWFSRIVVGVLFIFSGFIKANDPIGFSYKLEEYFEKFSSIFSENGLSLLSYPMDWMAEVALPLAIFIVVAEMVLGALTLTGTYMKKVSWSLLVMIVFFTFLTFISWYFEIVKSCGCFGEVIPLTPYESFLKDLVLLVLILVLFVFRNSINSLFSIQADKVALGFSSIVAFLFTWYCYQHLPIMDFRPYAPGSALRVNMEIEKGNPLVMYQLKHKASGEVCSFADYPKDYQNWEYIKAEEIDGEIEVSFIEVQSTKQKTAVLEIPTFFEKDWKVLSTKTAMYTPDKDPKIMNLGAAYYKDLDRNYIDVMLDHPKPYFWLVLRSVDEFGDFVQSDAGTLFKPNSYGANFWKSVRLFSKQAKAEEVKYHIMTSEPSYDKLEAIKHEMELNLQFYICDDTELKTMVRSSPGLILLKKDSVINKWHHNDFMKFEEINNQYLKQ